MGIKFFFNLDTFPKELMDQVIKIDAAVMDFQWTKEQWEDYLDKELNWMVAVEMEEDLVRCFALFQLSSEDWSHLLKIGVSQAFKRRGIATFLLHKSLEWLSGNFSTCSLEVRADNQAAINLYKSHQFELSHQVGNYYSDGSTAIKMIATLH